MHGAVNAAWLREEPTTTGRLQALLERGADMHVAVPATNLHPSVIPAILASGYFPTVYSLKKPTDYGELMAELWEQRMDLCIVEHDVEVNPHTLLEFEECPELWCAAPYMVGEGWATGFGCSRFRYPRPIPAIKIPMAWANVESAYMSAMKAAGYRYHVHGEVTHHHEY
jgi:hypothetical protein